MPHSLKLDIIALSLDIHTPTHIHIHRNIYIYIYHMNCGGKNDSFNWSCKRILCTHNNSIDIFILENCQDVWCVREQLLDKNKVHCTIFFFLLYKEKNMCVCSLSAIYY